MNAALCLMMVVVALDLVPAIAAAQPVTARISGVVVDDRERPLAGATVALPCPPARVRYATTGEAGNFLLEDLPPGKCRLLATKEGYVSAAHAGDPGISVSGGYSLLVRQGELRDGLRLQLTRGGQIVGQVTTPDGEPPPTSSLHLLRREIGDGTERLIAILGKVSADGTVRTGALPAGDYLVAAAPTFDNGSATPAPFALTYFPGVLHIEEASVITVRAGNITRDVNFSLKPVETRTVRGIALDAAGKPVSTGSEGISFAAGPAFIRGDVRLSTAGTFAIRGLQPARYRLTISKKGQSGRIVESATADIEIGLHDVTDLVLHTRPVR